MQCVIPEEIRLKTEQQTEFFVNRLQKKARHLGKWASRNGIHAYRIYGRDIPEIPLDVDLYEDAFTGEKFLHISFYQYKDTTDNEDEKYRLKKLTDGASKTLSIPEKNIFIKTRKRQRGEKSQYEKLREKDLSFFVEEYGSLIKVNLSDYLDTGLFLDHRALRHKIRQKAAGKKILNLFCYTGAFSVQAAAGGAALVTSVDLSKTYLSRAKENMDKNGFISGARGQYEFICTDVMEFLQEKSTHRKEHWDIIICDPPTFSNSKRTKNDLDTDRDWAFLCGVCLKKLSIGGTLYFSTNSKRLRFDMDKITPPTGTEILCRDITAETIPEDFRGKKPHRCWEITMKEKFPPA